MKKIICLAAALLLLTGCGRQPQETEPTSAPEAPELLILPEETEAAEEPETLPEVPPEPVRALVVYFSCTGTTEALAQLAAEHLDAELFRLTPAEPYSDGDLNYRVEGSRVNREQSDPEARPAIAGELPEVSEFELVVLAHPIWWEAEPRIVDSFLDAVELSGIMAAEFVTSGGSGVEAAYENLKQLEPEANWLGAVRFPGSADAQTVGDWLDSLLN